MIELGSVATFDVGADLGAQAEAAPAVGRFGELPRHLGSDHGAAGEGHCDAGEDLDLCGERDSGTSEVGGAASLGDHDAGEPGGVGVACAMLTAGYRVAAGRGV